MSALEAHVKSAVVASYCESYDVATIVETGLYLGHGTGYELWRRGLVPDYVAIDCDPATSERVSETDQATDGFELVIGDSAVELPALLERRHLLTPVLFWLDAHYNDPDEHPAGVDRCPLLAELEAIIGWRSKRETVVLVDDLDAMGVRPGFPDPDRIRALVDCAGVWYREEADGIMRLVPR